MERNRFDMLSLYSKFLYARAYQCCNILYPPEIKEKFNLSARVRFHAQSLSRKMYAGNGPVLPSAGACAVIFTAVIVLGLELSFKNTLEHLGMIFSYIQIPFILILHHYTLPTKNVH